MLHHSLTWIVVHSTGQSGHGQEVHDGRSRGHV